MRQLLFAAMASSAQKSTNKFNFEMTAAYQEVKSILVRPPPISSFAQCQTTQTFSTAMDTGLAMRQWAHYVQTIDALCGSPSAANKSDQETSSICIVQSDEKCPDCCFVEDTCVLVRGMNGVLTALVTRPGHPSRRPETAPIRDFIVDKWVLNDQDRVIEMHAPGCLDGGDVLCTGKHIFVGKSKRTNVEGIQQLRDAFQDIMPVHAIETEGESFLHLKSVVTHVTDKLLVVHSGAEGKGVYDAICRAVGSDDLYEVIWIPDLVSANVLTFPAHKTVLVQNRDPESLMVFDQELRQKLGWKVIEMDMSELVKADSGLTCSSVLLY